MICEAIRLLSLVGGIYFGFDWLLIIGRSGDDAPIQMFARLHAAIHLAIAVTCICTFGIMSSIRKIGNDDDGILPRINDALPVALDGKKD